MRFHMTFQETLTWSLKWFYKAIFRFGPVLTLICKFASAHDARFYPVEPLRNFKKGNLHAHSLRSDGDSTPEDVIIWYREQGYHFLALTDHNRASVWGEFVAIETESFRVLPAEEVSFDVHKSPSDRLLPVHVNSFCGRQTVGGHVGQDVTEVLAKAINEVRLIGGLAQVNHPNYDFALTLENFKSLTGTFLLEVENQHPYVNTSGRIGGRSTEQLWDALLTQGFSVFGTATDDLHDLRRTPDFLPRRGAQGWVQVASKSLEPIDICQALTQGRFYFSTGVELESIAVDGDILSVQLKTGTTAPLHTIQFIGTDGIGLGQIIMTESIAKYRLVGGGRYVRAVVSRADGKKAWTQPFYIR